MKQNATRSKFKEAMIQGGWFGIGQKKRSYEDDISYIKGKATFMHPKLMAELDILPQNVIRGVADVMQSFTAETNFYVSSILSDMNGVRRTRANGPNHSQAVAIDLVPTPFDTPIFKDQRGKPRSPHFNWNPYLEKHLKKVNSNMKVPCCVLIEPDHLHFDSNHEPGIYVMDSDKSCYHNSSPPGYLATKLAIRKVGSNYAGPGNIRRALSNFINRNRPGFTPVVYDSKKTLKGG